MTLSRLLDTLAALDPDCQAPPVVHILYDVAGGQTCHDRKAFVVSEHEKGPAGPIRALLIHADAEIRGRAMVPLLPSTPVEPADKRLTRSQAARRLGVSVSTLKRLEPGNTLVRLESLPGWEPAKPTDTVTLATERRMNRRGSSRARGDKSLPLITVTEAAGTKTVVYRASTVIGKEDVPAESVDGIYAWLMAPDGRPYVDALGRPAVTALDALALWQLGATEPDGTLLSSAELASRLGVSLSTLKRMVARGEVPAPIEVGERGVRFRLGDVRDAL